MNYKERIERAKSAKPGDKWVNIKTGRYATILHRIGLYGIALSHESGRKTVKLEHYFANDYTPYSDDNQPLMQDD